MPRKILTKEERAIRLRRHFYRRWSLRDPKRIDAVEASRRPYKGDNKRQKWEYQCSHCKKWFKKTEVEVDHVQPCGELLVKEDEIKFRNNLVNNDLQILCKPCHRKKTNLENEQRRKLK